MYYYLSIGTNIDPEKNAALIVELLAQQFQDVLYYPFIYTQPLGMDTCNIFLNSLAVVHSSLPIEGFKQELNRIEVHLGRDRSDPQRSVKDRTADIDILGHSEALQLSFFSNFEEEYIADVVRDEPPRRVADLSAQGLPSADRATTIHFNRRSGHKVIAQEAFHSLING